MSTNITMNTSTDGLQMRMTARATFDATGGKAVAFYPLGVTLPANAIIVRSYYHVITTFTSSTDAAEIKLGCESQNQIKLVVAISNVANPWDAGIRDGIQTGTTATFLHLTTETRELTATVSVQNLLSGKLILFVEYVVSDAL